MSPLQIQIEGVGVWAPGIADYRQLPASETGLAPAADACRESRPPASSLSSNERRRAPEGVLLAVEVADQAIRMSGRSCSELLSVFNSSRGDQTIIDYICRTLAKDPFDLSPTKFHNSVHNAPAGYWGIASGAMGTSAAISTEMEWPGLSLLDAMALAVCEQQAVLWVCSETRGVGPLLQLSGYTSGMACALVLAPVQPGGSQPRLSASLQTTSDSDSSAVSSDHPVASLLPWLAALADGGRSHLAIAPRLVLQIDTQAGVL